MTIKLPEYRRKSLLPSNPNATLMPSDLGIRLLDLIFNVASPTSQILGNDRIAAQ